MKWELCTGIVRCALLYTAYSALRALHISAYICTLYSLGHVLCPAYHYTVTKVPGAFLLVSLLGAEGV